MSSLENDAFQDLIQDHWPALPEDARHQLIRFRELVIEGSKAQNLTRLLSPKDFFYGHLVDVRELISLDWVTGSALDLGSGAGIPGIPWVIATGKKIVLAESEKRKAEFLESAVEALGLVDDVEVFAGRAEKILTEASVETILCRGVGSITKIYRLLRPCSTWNSLILFKGPKWKEEWESFSKKKEVELTSHDYKAFDRNLSLIRLKRV